MRHAQAVGYLVTLHVLLVPENLAVQRVADRVTEGGHSVPESKTRARHRRLWTHIGTAVSLAAESFVYDNSSPRKPFRLVAHFKNGRAHGEPTWPAWAPNELVRLR